MSPKTITSPVPGIEGTTIAITGGASGIGRATARSVAVAGGRVIVGDVDTDSLAELGDLAKSEQLDITTMTLDVSDPDSIAHFIDVAAVDASFGGLVCSAAICPDFDVLEMPLHLWDRVMTINLRGTFLPVQLAARALARRGRRGSIVTIASAVGITGGKGLSHYAASKGGVIALTRSLARELGSANIRVNCVSPGGGVNTKMYTDRATPETIAARVAQNPLARLGEPEDVANCIVFLLSDLSDWITGQNVNVNGGSIMP
jgi:3-oxoacyl-[acyl-carrier protein] reductase